MLLNQLTHPEKILYAEQGITKLQLADYYERIQEWILPYVVNRPLTLVRCPEGRQHNCFYQKHFIEKMPDLYPIAILEKEKKANYIYIKDAAGLITLVQLGVLEIHAWNCHIDQVEKPDVVIFDLDPAPDVPWKKVIETATLIRALLTELKLKSFVKTSGGKGLHIVLPIKRDKTWAEIKTFAHEFVKLLVAEHPDAYVDKMTKATRKGKIYIDYLRNQRGSTTIIPYSTRARANAPIATPLFWEELTPKIKPDFFTLNTIFKRLDHLKSDPWAEFWTLKQRLVL